MNINQLVRYSLIISIFLVFLATNQQLFAQTTTPTLSVTTTPSASASATTSADTVNVIPDFKDAHADYYNWAKTNLFDGLEFYTVATNSAGSGASATDLVDYTLKLAGALEKACPPGNTSNIGHVPNIPGGCQDTLKQSKGGAFEDKVINGFQPPQPLQCIMFVYGITLHFNKPIILTDAKNEAQKQPNYDYIPGSSGIGKLQAGDFMVWTNAGPGHIAVVTAVNATANSYTITDANWDENGSVETHEIPFTTGAYGIIVMSGWLRMQGQTPTGGTTGAGPGPNKNTCNNRYVLNNPKGENFGDPNCEIADPAKAVNIVSAQIQTADSANAAKWVSIVQCESGFNPNAWTDHVGSVHTPAPNGAWGLFQMGSSMGAVGDSGGTHDRGDVYWKTQISNAIQYAKDKNLTNLGSYWACAQ